MVVRSIVGTLSSALRICGMGGLFRPVLTFTVEWMMGRP
jgi:hypothetical protein